VEEETDSEVEEEEVVEVRIVEEHLDVRGEEQYGNAEKTWYGKLPKDCPLMKRPKLVPIVKKPANPQKSGGRASAERHGIDGKLAVREIGRLVPDGKLTVEQERFANMEADMCVWRATYTFGMGCMCFGSKDITVIQIKKGEVSPEIWNNWLRLAGAVSLPCDVITRVTLPLMSFITATDSGRRSPAV
jgi:hypothetical protein